VDGRVSFAAVDCTGHGVPGAFMSLIGHNGLNQAIRERGSGRPSEVLKTLNRIAFEALHKDREQFLVRDGMDMALCKYDPERRVLEYAGANAPLYVVRGGEVLRFHPDKRPIGSFDLEGQEFTDHRILLEQGDMVYIFSDGYADQFGGPKGKNSCTTASANSCSRSAGSRPRARVGCWKKPSAVGVGGTNRWTTSW